MKHESDNYNLLAKRWIPVLWTGGKFGRVGIRKALQEAGRIRQIAASNPMDNVAILRLLLALLYWCKGNPPDEGRGVSGDSSIADWFSKLDANRDCFNLLGEGTRFYQDRRAERSRASTDLIQEIPTGNNFWHFRHSTDGMNGLCAACCAMGLLRLPLFSVSGLPDLKAGINGTPPIYVVQLGISLLETLCLNWVPRVELGDPAWVQPDIFPGPAAPVPLLTGLTLLSRRVWLHEPSGPPDRCVCCGAMEPALIRTCEFQTAGKQENNLWNDPHVVYLDRNPRKAFKAPDLTAAGKFRMDRPWLDLLTRIVETAKFGLADDPTSLLVVGFATDKAKNIDVWERTIGLPSTGSKSQETASLIQRWQTEGSSLARRIRPPNEKASARKHIEIPATLDAVRPHVENRVSARLGELMAGAAGAWNHAAAEYHPMMNVIAQSLSPGFTTAAVSRRKQIAAVTPRMLPQDKPAKKTRRKKGGEK